MDSGFVLSIPQSNDKIKITKEQQEWYVIRDMYFGFNYVARDVKKAIAFAATCNHPDAQWLAKVYASYNDCGIQRRITDVFTNQGEEDARALTFAALLCYPIDKARLRKAADMGYAFAQSQMKQFKYALQAALQGEREAFVFLQSFHRYKHFNCDNVVSDTLANEYLYGAALLGSINCFGALGWTLKEWDPRRWHWWGLLARFQGERMFIRHFSSVVSSTDPIFLGAVFMIGKMFNGHINVTLESFFGIPFSRFKEVVHHAFKAVEFYTKQCKCARLAVDTWSLVALRIGNCIINRDMRKKIGMLIWNARELAEY